MPQSITQPIFNYKDQSTPTVTCSIPSTKSLPQESKSSDQSFGYIKVNSFGNLIIGPPLSFYDTYQIVYSSQNILGFRHIREVKYHGKLSFTSTTSQSVTSHDQHWISHFLAHFLINSFSLQMLTFIISHDPYSINHSVNRLLNRFLISFD